MTPSRRALALVAGALAAAGLVALPAASSPAGAAGGDSPQTLRAKLAAPVHGLDARLSHGKGTTRAAGSHVVPQKVDSAGRQTVYVDGSDPAALKRAVESVGGKVTGSLPGLVRARVPADALSTLAGRSGVRMVRPPVQLVADSVTSEGVAASGADTWQSVGTGAGVKVGIVDLGFGGLAAAQAAGDLPATGADLTVTAEPGCEQPDADPHGTAVTEIVHDMAPDAQLYLVCVWDIVDVGTAADFLHDQGVSVVNMSLSAPEAAARGDGTGPLGDIIKRSRQQGLLWSVAAGNAGETHFRGKVADGDHDTYVQFAGTDELNHFTVAPNGVFSMNLQWEHWPVSTTGLDIYLMTSRATPDLDFTFDPPAPNVNDPDIWDFFQFPGFSESAQPPIDSVSFKNPNPTPLDLYLVVGNFGTSLGTQFDVQIEGPISPLQYHTAGSITEPANSPYAMAVGAACVKDGTLEPYSSQGPTIDGRTKPDITAFDGVSTTTFGTPSAGTSCVDGFRGTSAAAPHVTGAAALVKSANPSFDAAQIQNYLEQHATPKGTANEFGHGVLNMGPQQTPQAPQGDTYQPLAAPQRILDTRTTNGGHLGKLGPDERYTLSVPGLSPDATAIAVNVTGTNPTHATDIDVYPEVFTGTSTLNLVTNQTAAVFTMVALGPNHTIKVRNAGGETHVVIDLIGQFVPTGGATFVPNSPPTRILDTRTATGGHQGRLGPGEIYALPVRGVGPVPADASAVIVNVTGVNQSTTTFLSVFPDQPTSSSTLNLSGTLPRANLTAVGIGPDGAIRIRNTAGLVNVVIDLEGWFVPDGGARFVALNPNRRILDTRHGNGLRLGAVRSQEAINVQGSELYGVPYGATAVAFNLTAVGTTAPQTFEIAWPAGLPRPGTSNLNLATGQVVPNAVVVGTGQDGMVSLYNAAGNTHLLVDLYGYFAP